ncbi:MAG TPA: hypothetical protein VHW24_24010 [Bryobacteraceae bacterium]|jgi:hypothetical protein|nr:hypothetical protein [Bryobacteraceae bacterium]
MAVPLTVRQTQIDALSDMRRQAFEGRMVDHLNRFFTRRADRIGEAGLRELIRGGIVRAGKYGFRTEQEVCRFIGLMLVFGERFDEDTAWAAEILLNPAIEDRPKQLMVAAKARAK